MFMLTIKELAARKLRLLTTAFAVLLGVAFMAGTMVLTDTMQATFDGVIASANDGTDVIVQRSGAIDGEAGTVRDRVDAGVVAQVAGVDGVDAAAGSVQGFAQLRAQQVHIGTRFVEQVTHGATLLVEQCGHDMERLDVLVVAAKGE